MSISVSRVNSGIYDVHVFDGGDLRYVGRVQKTVGDGGYRACWTYFIGHNREYDREFDTKRAALNFVQRTVS